MKKRPLSRDSGISFEKFVIVFLKMSTIFFFIVTY